MNESFYSLINLLFLESNNIPQWIKTCYTQSTLHLKWNCINIASSYISNTTTTSALSPSPPIAKFNIKAGGNFLPGCRLFVLQQTLQTLTHLCLYLWVNVWVRGRSSVPPVLKVYWRFCGSLQSVNAYPGNFVGPLCWIMTEWERSHRDKTREAERKRELGGKERKQMKAEEGIWSDVIVKSLWWLPQRVNRVMI